MKGKESQMVNIRAELYGLFLFWVEVAVGLLLIKSLSYIDNSLMGMTFLSLFFLAYLPMWGNRLYKGEAVMPIFNILLLIVAIIALCGGFLAAMFSNSDIGNMLIIISGALNGLLLIYIFVKYMWCGIKKRKMLFSTMAMVYAYPMWYFPFLVNTAVKL